MSENDDQKTRHVLQGPLKGHEQACAVFARGLAEGRIHHGWIIAGPKGIGKFRFSIQIACWLFNQMEGEGGQLDPGDPQTLNSDEAKLVLSGGHPDLLVIQAAEEDNRSGQIKTEQLKKLTHFFSHSAARGGWRIAIIDSLDQVNRNGMNAMLKILEEPPTKCMILLLTSRAGQILPTITSRTTRLDLLALRGEECEAVLADIWPESDADYRRQLSFLAKGAPGQAVLLGESGAIPLFEQFCELIGRTDVKLSDIGMLAEKWAVGGAKGAGIRQAARYLFDETLYLAAIYEATPQRAEKSMFMQIDYARQAITRLAQKHSCERLAKIHQTFQTASAQGEGLYLDFAPIMTDFFFDLHQEKK